VVAAERAVDVESIQWSEPPLDSRGGGRRHRPIAEALKNKPGEWAMIGTYPNARSSGQIAYAIRQASLVAYRPAGAFEAVGRRGQVFARYVGETDAQQ
jgi:hypothetical protein